MEKGDQVEPLRRDTIRGTPTSPSKLEKKAVGEIKWKSTPVGKLPTLNL